MAQSFDKLVKSSTDENQSHKTLEIAQQSDFIILPTGVKRDDLLPTINQKERHRP